MLLFSDYFQGYGYGLGLWPRGMAWLRGLVMDMAMARASARDMAVARDG